MSMSNRPRSTRAKRRAPIRNIKQSNPAGLDYSLEYTYIRRDLIRILSIGFGLIGFMIVLAVLNVF
ncbi:MAG TPA: hypothetical protein VD886_02465 [Herpetosiphonaceae bacterium]|nr:hypothetical protein [Herpetosiphonaceae bacterium]